MIYSLLKVFSDSLCATFTAILGLGNRKLTATLVAVLGHGHPVLIEGHLPTAQARSTTDSPHAVWWIFIYQVGTVSVTIGEGIRRRERRVADERLVMPVGVRWWVSRRMGVVPGQWRTNLFKCWILDFSKSINRSLCPTNSQRLCWQKKILKPSSPVLFTHQV